MVTGIAEHHHAIHALFEMDGTARARRPLSFSPPKVPPLREPFGARRCVPLHSSPAPRTAHIEDFVDGARRLGFIPSPHQLRFARIMAARNDADRPLHRRTANTEPRRSGKTDGLFALIIGRCTNRDDFHAAFSAQTGAKGRKRFLAMAAKLERWDPCLRDCARTDAGHVHYRIYRSNGGERIEWSNGSTLDVLPPDPENYRGDEYDLIVLDEAQEMTADDVADELLGGVLSTLDTRDEAQLIVAGTAGAARSGLLWNALVKGRAGEWAILEYAAPDHADPLDERTWLAAHPGIGTLTRLEVIRERLADLGLINFQREYLGQWPVDASVSAIDPEHWARQLAAMSTRPAKVGLAFDVSPDSSAGALACAWRDAAGHAYIELLAFRAGVSWLPVEAHRVAREAHVALAYDVIGANTNPADSVHRRRPPVKLLPMGVKDTIGAAQRVVSELADGTAHHFGQVDLDLAVRGASWRNVGVEGGRAFGHKASEHNITPLTAGALALWAFDKTTATRRRRRTIPTAPTAPSRAA